MVERNDAGPIKTQWNLKRARKLVMGIAGFLFLSVYFGANRERAIAGINDFMALYAGAGLVGTQEQYSVEAYVREQERTTGWTAPAMLYIRPPIFAFLLRPLRLFDYWHAYAIWQVLSVSAFAAFLILWPFRDRPWLWVAACWSFPLFACLWNGQDTTFVLLALAAAWRLRLASPFTAGAVLALAAAKFHLFMVVVVFLAAHRHWRMLAGGALTTVIVIALCFAIAGANWIPEYLHFVLQERVSPGITFMPNLHGILGKLPYSVALEVAAALLVSLGSVYIARKTDFDAGLSAALVASLLVSHHAYLADMLILLPALLTLAARLQSELVHILCILLLSPLPFLIQTLVPRAAPLPVLLITLFAAVLIEVRKDRALSPQPA